MGLDKYPIFWSIRLGGQPSPDNSLAPGRNRKGISTSNPAGTFAVSLGTGRVNPATIRNDAFPFSLLSWRSSSNRPSLEQFFPTICNDIHAQKGSMRRQTRVPDNHNSLLWYGDPMDLQVRDQSLQMVTRVHFTLSTATHDNSQWIRSPLAVPADSLLSIDDTVHPKLCGKCTMNTQLALEVSNQMLINSGTVSPNCCIQRVLEALGFPYKNYRWHLTARRSNIGPLPLFVLSPFMDPNPSNRWFKAPSS